eukprot:364639-Chlamydomonas_euryale.AAC.53
MLVCNRICAVTIAAKCTCIPPDGSTRGATHVNITFAWAASSSSAPHARQWQMSNTEKVSKKAPYSHYDELTR